MTLLERLYPKFVSFLGSLGLGTALAYLILGGYSYATGNQVWLWVLVTWGPWAAVVPFGALLAHLYLRTHLGAWYLDRGEPEAAADYTGDRLEHSWLRSRRETLWHRLYLGRAEIARGRYAEALARLTRGFAPPEPEKLQARYRRWQLEAALRLDDHEMVDEALEGAVELSAAAETRGSIRACAGEAAVLEGNREAYHTHLDEARWLTSAPARADFVEAMGTVRFGHTDGARQTAIECIRRSRGTMATEVPGRGAEWYAIWAELLVALGREREAERVLEDVDEASADDRSLAALERAEQRLERARR